MDGKEDLALWRYGIISTLLHRQANGHTLSEMLHDLAQKNYVRPDGRQVNVAPETMRKWLYRYTHGGLPALQDNERSDKGTSDIPQNLIDAIFALRKAHPRWNVSLILQRLFEAGCWNGSQPSRSSLYRFAKTHNLGRDPHLDNTEASRAFAFDAFGQLWVADFLHGPKLHEGRNRRKTYLHAIMDDCSRFVVSAGFFHAETVETLLTELMNSVNRFGVPQRFYTDNGACYASRHLKIVCARLGIHLVHTPPYRPQGRGKIERFFRTVREQFLDLDQSKTLPEINSEFQTWLANYHQRLHSSIDCSPLNMRLNVPNVCRRLPGVIDIEPLFRMERRCLVYKDTTIRLFGKVFEVPDCLPNSRITVYFLPWNLDTVYYGDEMKPARLLDRSANARRFSHPGHSRGGSHEC